MDFTAPYAIYNDRLNFPGLGLWQCEGGFDTGFYPYPNINFNLWEKILQKPLKDNSNFN